MGIWGAWGYRRPVCLVTEITPGRELRPSSEAVTLSAELVWMCCSKTCHPGSATLSLTVPVSDEPVKATAAAEFFAATRAEQPVDANDWKFSARRTDDGFELTVVPAPGAAVPDDAYFFNYQRLVDSHQTERRRDLPGGGAVFELKLTESPEEIPLSLDGILHSKAGFGRHHSLKVSARLKP
jgi:DsbC/DsbD-like thiol-disulfide interchange protein